MRRFSSYGPVDPELHYCVPRRALVEACVEQLVGDLEKGGHYFTIWAPRQAGKTWLIRRAMEEIRARYGDRFLVGAMSMQGIVFDDDEPGCFFKALPRLFRESFRLEIPEIGDWEAWMRLLREEGGVFERPAILLIDEFDSLPGSLIDHLVGMFRQIHLKRGAYHLHGLALIGVRAVLGVERTKLF
jgi:predicted AAA+ superfamily ATPase